MSLQAWSNRLNDNKRWILPILAGLAGFEVSVVTALYSKNKSQWNLAALIVGWVEFVTLALMSLLFFFAPPYLP
jgi:hypothetical protein